MREVHRRRRGRRRADRGDPAARGRHRGRRRRARPAARDDLGRRRRALVPVPRVPPRARRGVVGARLRGAERARRRARQRRADALGHRARRARTPRSRGGAARSRRSRARPTASASPRPSRTCRSTCRGSSARLEALGGSVSDRDARPPGRRARPRAGRRQLRRARRARARRRRHAARRARADPPRRADRRRRVAARPVRLRSGCSTSSRASATSCSAGRRRRATRTSSPTPRRPPRSARAARRRCLRCAARGSLDEAVGLRPGAARRAARDGGARRRHGRALLRPRRRGRDARVGVCRGGRARSSRARWADCNARRDAGTNTHMHFFSRHKTNMIDAADALPGRDQAMPRPRAPRRARHPARAAVPRGPRDRRLRPRLLLGRGARVLAGARRVHDRGRLRRRLHAEPDLRGGLQRADRPRRGRARRLRPEADELRRAAEAASGRATTRPRACARATTSAPSTARRSTRRPTPSARPPTPSRDDVPGRARRRAATARSRPRSRRCGHFYYAEDYHQQYLAKNPNGYCGLGGTGVSCPIGVGVARRPATSSLRYARNGSGPAALIVFMANWDVIRATPGRSANVSIRNRS